MGIFELTQLDDLPAAPSDKTLAATAVYDGNGYIRAHNISINEATGFAYLTGVSKDASVDPNFLDDGMVILDLINPLTPVEVGQVYGRDTHDAQIVNYNGPDGDHQYQEIAVVFNGVDLTVGIYDVTTKGIFDLTQNPSMIISETGYDGASFTHQGWLTEDHKYLLVGDEEDELFGISDPQNPDLPDTTRTYVFDMNNLESPVLLCRFDAPYAAIDHNMFVKGDKLYQANYTSGITVWEIPEAEPDPSAVNCGMVEIGHMDTEPRLPNIAMNHNINIFVGPWGVFPFFDSGTIIASDGLNGLIIMRLSS